MTRVDQNVQRLYRQGRQIGRMYTFVGVKGGVGTTTAAINFAALCAKQNKSTILLDLDPALVPARTDNTNDAGGLREQQTRFDAEEEQFHQRVREAFLVLARIHPQRIKVLDASLPPELLHEQIIALVEPLLAEM